MMNILDVYLTNGGYRGQTPPDFVDTSLTGGEILAIFMVIMFIAFICFVVHVGKKK